VRVIWHFWLSWNSKSFSSTIFSKELFVNMGGTNPIKWSWSKEKIIYQARAIPNPSIQRAADGINRFFFICIQFSHNNINFNKTYVAIGSTAQW
jgi:hypothetical protein